MFYVDSCYFSTAFVINAAVRLGKKKQLSTGAVCISYLRNETINNNGMIFKRCCATEPTVEVVEYVHYYLEIISIQFFLSVEHYYAPEQEQEIVCFAIVIATVDVGPCNIFRHCYETNRELLHLFLYRFEWN